MASVLSDDARLWQSFETTDPDLARERVGQMYNYSSSQRLSAEDRARFRMRLTGGGFDANRLRVDRLEYTAAVQARVDSYQSLVAARIAGGTLRMSTGKHTLNLAAGDTVLVDPIRAQDVAWGPNTDMHLMRLDLGQTCELAHRLSGLPVDQVRFDLSTPISPMLAQHWWDTTRYVTSLFEHEGLLDEPLIRAEALRLLATTVLHTFPNTALDLLSDPTAPSPGPVGPAALRRAVDYIDSHADQPIGLPEITAASRIGVRALQQAFRRHYDTTPLGYLRRVRLGAAHRDLQAADPTRGDTVAAIAARWGFAHPARFARDYHAAYGQLPSQTLRA